MTSLSTIIQDVEGTIAQRSSPARERTLEKITDLLVRDAERLGTEQIAVFDHVLGCFTPIVPVTARAGLAERLSELSNAPPGVTRALAFDEDIVVARPILTRCSQLSDQDLIDIAVTRGTGHMAAICDRGEVSEIVTDVLVTKGDDRIWRAIAGNSGARFSELGRAELLDRSREDETLQDLLGEREDLTETDLNRLLDIAREGAKARVVKTLAPVNRPTPPARKASQPARLDYSDAQDTLRAITKKRPVTETDLAAFAKAGRTADAIAAIALMGALPVAMVERIFRERDDASLLIIGKANNWSWRTVRALLGLRDPRFPEPNGGTIEPSFDAISASGARRAVMSMLEPGAKGAARPRQPGVRRDGT